MTGKYFLAVLLAMAVIFSPWTLAQEAEGAAAEETQVSVPQSAQQAQELFIKAFNLEKEENFSDALKSYDAVLSYYSKEDNTQYKMYCMYTLNNMGIIVGHEGRHREAVQLFQRALRYATQLDMHMEVAQFYYKLGILHAKIGELAAQRKAEKGKVIYPTSEQDPTAEKVFYGGDYRRLVRVGESFIGQNIDVAGAYNPFDRKNDSYSKVINLKVRSDFDRDSLLTPDSVQFLVQIRKRGYYPVIKNKEMLPVIEYSELDETMVAIPRKVESQISEDFYQEGFTSPDEITLTSVRDGENAKPVQINDKTTFKPGHYRLVVKKAGYENIDEGIVIHPDEGSFALRRTLQSKLRDVDYRIQGDFNVFTDAVTPDRIALNDQEVNDTSKVKPGKYKLEINKEGYEPIVRNNVMITPSERPYLIEEFMKTLPREVMFQLTGDYREDEQLTPDEVTFNGRYVKVTGTSVRPDKYRVVISKKGYEPISESYVIEPKSTTYVVKGKMTSLPRRVQTNIFASFPARLRIFPDTCTLNGKDVATVENFKPGTYTLYIKHRGYHPITREVEIPPSSEPYVIREIVQAKDVKINLNVTYDVAAQDPTIPYKAFLINEKTRESIPFQSGNKVKPESYLLKVERPGYEPDVQRVLLMPSESDYSANRRMVAMPRRIVTQIGVEYPETGGNVVPDEITLDNKGVKKDSTAKPGVHDLVILKEGYLPVRKQIKILASAQDYFLSERLETRTRLVSFEFEDSFDRRKLEPEEIFLGTQQVASSRDSLSLKPGEYGLRVKLSGYAPLEEMISMPVSSGPYVIKRQLIAIKRDVHIDLTSDYSVGEEAVEPDLLTLNDIPVVDRVPSQPSVYRTTVKPDLFNVVIQKDGFFPVLERLTIPPGRKPFLIKHRLVSKPRKLLIQIKSSFSGEAIVPENIVLGAQEVKDGQLVKPGEYAVVIKEKGYKTISTSVVIEPSEESYTLSYTMESLPRPVQYQLVSDFDNQEVVPDLITLNDKIVDQKTDFLPGKYAVKVEKRGYHPKELEVVIEPGTEPYVISTVLESIAREIELMITGDFPRGEAIDPEEVSLSGKDARDNLFKPGKYDLQIAQPGYFPMVKSFIIEPGEEPFLIEEELVTKPRQMKERIEYDVEPPEGLGPYKITMAPLDNPKAETPVKDGDMIKPNSYVLRIKKEAYEPIEITKHVWPDESPLIIEEMLVAKQVEVHINISHDVEPPSDLPPYKVSLIDQMTKVLQFISHGKKIKPGSYDLDIQRPGYIFGTQKPIRIIPSEEPYQINEKLIAAPRRLSFDMAYQGRLVPAHKVINMQNGQAISYKDKFKPGTELNLLIKFLKYKTVTNRAIVPPGDGPFVVAVQLEQLKRYDFSSRKKEMKIDGHTYNYTFSSDNKKIEDHLVSVEKGFGRWHFTVRVGKDAKNFKVYAGYYYAQIPFSRLRTIGRLASIDIPKLIEHLDLIAKKDNRERRASVEVLEKMLRTFSGRKKLSQAHSTEIDQLIQAVESWRPQLPSAQDRIRIQVMLDTLNKLKG